MKLYDDSFYNKNREDHNYSQVQIVLDADDEHRNSTYSTSSAY